MSSERTTSFSKYAREYDPIKCSSIDGTDTEPHDRGIIRALNSSYRPNSRVVGEPLCTIFIGRLHIKTTEETLQKHFEKFGKIIRCRIVRDIVTGMSKCYGFIEFHKESSAYASVREMKRKYIDECEIVVEHECERILKGWKPRRLGGGFGGKKESGQLRFGGRAKPFLRPVDIKNNEFADRREVFRDQKISNAKR